MGLPEWWSSDALETWTIFGVAKLVLKLCALNERTKSP
jgi:hypothetical protein